MLKTENLSYTYPNSKPLTFPNIDCAANEHKLLLGHSGCGKTTLLHLLGGLLTPKKGFVEINNVNIAKLSGAALDRFRGQNIGIIFQKSHFVQALTTEENLLLAQKLAGLTTDKKRVQNLLERLNVGHKLKKSTKELSQGEQQRVAIARALINHPKVILADEPTSALDDKNAEEVISLLEEEARNANAALLVVTHDGRLKERFSEQIEIAKQYV